jgi:hypothetical protein
MKTYQESLHIVESWSYIIQPLLKNAELQDARATKRILISTTCVELHHGRNANRKNAPNRSKHSYLMLATLSAPARNPGNMISRWQIELFSLSPGILCLGRQIFLFCFVVLVEFDTS